MIEKNIQSISDSPRSNRPYNMGIKEFKRFLSNTQLSKSDKNKAIRTYKQRIAERLVKVAAQFQEAIEKQEKA